MSSATPGERLKSYREAAGLSVIEAAELAGINRNTVYDMEKDDEGVTMRMLKRYIPVLGVTLSMVFRDENEPERVPVEFHPLLEPLRGYDQPTREAVIRNVASNLTFMQMTAGKRRLGVSPIDGRDHKGNTSASAHTDIPGERIK